MTDKKSPITLSVIVPCYNVEQYLDLSLHCLERQWEGRTDYEIIFINDASKDGTIDRLKEFQLRYPDNVVVIDKQVNAGVSSARNSALDIARGMWITFFDPDDVLADNSYAKLMALAEQNDFDLIRFGVVVQNSVMEQIPVISEPMQINWQGSTLEYMQRFKFGISCCYLYKRTVLEGHRYPPLTICEDTIFNVSVLLDNHPIAQTDSKVYYYIVRPTSATNTINPARLNRHCDDIFKAIGDLQDLKASQDVFVQEKITEHQRLFSYNLLTRLLLSNQSVSKIKGKVKRLTELRLFPLYAGSLMLRLMNLVFSHPWLVPSFRPIYRSYRKRRSQ